MALKKEELRLILLHEFRLGRNAATACRNVNTAWGEATVADRTVRQWFQRFRDGVVDLTDRPGRGRPRVLDDDVLRTEVEANPSTTLEQLSETLHVDPATISRHLHSIGKVKKLEKWVPHELTEHQKRARLQICSDLSLRQRNTPFLDRVITCDEKWLLYDNRKRAAQWLDRGEAPRRFAKPPLHPLKVLITVWWSVAGLLHYRLLRDGETIDSTSYCGELDTVHRKLTQQRPGLVNRWGALLLHDNARPHTSRQTQQKLNALGIETLPHPAYSPDLSPTDYHLFRALDHHVRGRRFRSREDVTGAVADFFRQKDRGFYRDGIYRLTDRWNRCIAADGDYFE